MAKQPRTIITAPRIPKQDQNGRYSPMTMQELNALGAYRTQVLDQELGRINQQFPEVGAPHVKAVEKMYKDNPILNIDLYKIPVIKAQ